MTKDETTKVLSVIKASYPQFFAKWTTEQGINFLNVWTDMFEDDDAILVMMSVKSYIRSNASQFPPSVGQIVDLMQSISAPKSLDADKAWSMVYKALGNSIYNSVGEFNNLPTEVQAGVGSPQQLKSWAMMNTAELETVVSSNFKRGYRGRVDKKREFDKLPTQAKDMISALTEAKRIEIDEIKK